MTWQAVQEGSSTDKQIRVLWCSTCAVLTAFALALLYYGDQFAWEKSLENIPALWLAGGLAGAGLVYLLLVPLIHGTLRNGSAATPSILALIIICGFAMRLLMIPSMPALEDDFYRYLWDGAVSANGYNPYAIAPGRAQTEKAPQAIRQLAQDGALILDRVNHPQYKTIYPPVAQAAFAFAHWIEPWSPRAWRLVCLIGESASLVLLLMLLAATGRSALWVSLYWLNPLVIKELMNSAHMEAIVMPFVLGALTLLVLRRPVMAAATLGLAIGAKLWPVMLLPLVLRPLLAAPGRLLAALAILAVMAAAWVVPPLLGGLGSDSGFVAYATYWQTNSALFQALQAGVAWVLSSVEAAKEIPGMIVRVTMASIVAGAALWLARDDNTEPKIIVRRAAMVVGLLFLLSPAQFPWYASWVLIFAPFLPFAGLLGLTVLLPMYYVSFYLFGIDRYHDLNPWLLAVEWLLIWALIAWDVRAAWRQPLDADLSVAAVPRSPLTGSRI